MAVSGLIFIAFNVAHMYGNLKAFSGEVAYNEYSEHLRELGEPILPYSGALWIIRLVLIASLVVHVTATMVLWRRARRARPVPYAVKRQTGSSFSSRTMRWGGLTILVFLVWHLLNFSIVKVNPAGGETNNPYALMVDTFGVWWMTIIYLLAMAALGLHLHHGTFSSMQTLGFTGSTSARLRARTAGWVVAVVVAGGYSILPLAVLLGIVE